MNASVAIITGVTGQDGYYLTNLLLDKGYIVFGLARRHSSGPNLGHLFSTINHPGFRIHYGDITDAASVRACLAAAAQAAQAAQMVQAARIEIYNLAAQSHVKHSFDMPEYTLEVNGAGTLHLLEAIRTSPWKDRIRFYQASTSELYGKAVEVPQTERTPFYPRSPYAIAKLYAFWMTKHYREAYGLYAVNGILFNHESPLRGEEFVTRKITKAVASIAAGKRTTLVLGNLDVKKDWGHAKDYVEVMWRMLQDGATGPRDWVVATGEAHTVREFVEAAFAHVGIRVAWSGHGPDEKGHDVATGQLLVAVDPVFFRPTETETTVGDASDAHRLLGWHPTYTFEALVRDMMEADLREQASPTPA